MTLPNQDKIRYRIQHWQWFDEKALPTSEHWQVEIFDKGFTGWKWRPLKHTVCYGADCYKRPTEFESQDEAREVIERIAAGQPCREWITKEVDSV